MSTISTRLTLLERAIGKLVEASGPKVSQMLTEGLRDARAGKLEPQVFDIAALDSRLAAPGSLRRWPVANFACYAPCRPHQRPLCPPPLSECPLHAL